MPRRSCSRGCPLPLPLLLAAVLILQIGVTLALLGAGNVVRVRMGYLGGHSPTTTACGRGWLDLARNVKENLPAYKVECFKQPGVMAAPRLDNGDLDIAQLGSSPWATAVARGLDLKQVYIPSFIGEGAGIYVREDNVETGYEGIKSPSGLIDRNISTTFGTNMHYQLVFLLEELGLMGRVDIIDQTANEMKRDWESKPTDGYAGGGSFRQFLLDKGARVLMTADGFLGWGAGVGSVYAARRAFADEHPRFIIHLVGILSRITDSYLDSLGENDGRNPDRWDIRKNNSVNYVAGYIDAIMEPGEPGNVSYDRLVRGREEISYYDYLSNVTQLSCNYMGSSIGSCPKPTGQHVAAIQTAEFLLKEKFISSLGIMDPLFPANQGAQSCRNKSSFCGGDIIDPTYLFEARTGDVVGTPLGPYEGEFVRARNESGDQVLAQLEDLDSKNSQWSPFPDREIGRPPAGSVLFGHSNCTAEKNITGPLLNGTFGDGANALPGRSYSDKKKCRWTIYPPDDGGLVEVRVQRFRVWSGDFVRIYSGGVRHCPGNKPTKPRTLLAQLSGMYGTDELPDALPPFRSNTCIVVEFVTDGKPEYGYAVGEDYGDGFEISFSRHDVPKGDCNGQDSDPDGLCLCNGTSWGGDCSHRSFCIGESRVKIGKGTVHALLQSSVYSTKEALSSDDDIYSMIGHLYPNDLDCTYALDFSETSYNLARVELYYDTEETFDLLRLRSGLNDDSTYSVLSGRHQSRPEIFYIPIDAARTASLHFSTDHQGRRRGFYAKVSGSTEPRWLNTEVGDSTEQRFSTCKAGQFGSLCEASHCLLTNLPQKAAGTESEHGPTGLSIVSQHSSKSLRAMPWAPRAGCEWEIEPNADSSGAIRLNFTTLDFEPYPKSSVGDKLIFESSAKDQAEELFFIESCTSNSTCSEKWQTGNCNKSDDATSGHCEVHDQYQFSFSANTDKTLIRLVTDRNDGGMNFKGINFDVHHVQSCPVSNGYCKNEGGECDSKTNYCYCKNNVACDCSCEDPPSNRKAIAIGVSCAVIILLALLFWVYYRKNQKTLAMQASLLKSKEEELKRKEKELQVFRLGTSKFGEAVDYIDSLLKPSSLLSSPEDVEKLLLVKQCLIRGNDKKLHIPGNLEKSPGSRFIMNEFAGVNISNSQTTASSLGSTSDDSQLEDAGTFDCLPEFASLDTSKQLSLFELLSLSNLRRWDWNVFSVATIDEENTLLFVAWAIIGSPYSQVAMAKQLERSDGNPSDLDGYNFADLDLNIDMVTLFNYLRVIQRDYKATNPYHNAIHAADVVQTVHSLITMAGRFSDKEEIFSMLVAAAVHDVKHPGMNNAFQVNTLSHLALAHNDYAVLESEHSSHAFQIMIEEKNGSLNFLHHVAPPKFAEIRKRIVESVLHTDMSKHFSTVAHIKSQADKSWGEIDAKLRFEVLMYMLHLSDISNPAKPGPMFELWTDRCLDEFFAQGDEERKRGLPISPNCDRNKTKKPESQIGFIQFVVKPAYEVLASIFPAVGENVLPVIESNLAYWEGLKGRIEAV